MEVFLTSALCMANLLNQGLLGYYKFNGNALDISGNDRHGMLFGSANTIGNPPSFPLSLFNKSVSFDNFSHPSLYDVNCYAQLPKINFNSNTGFSVTFWGKFMSNATAKNNPTHSSAFYQLTNCTNSIAFDVDANGDVSASYGDGSTGYRSNATNIGTSWVYLTVVLNSNLYFLQKWSNNKFYPN